MSEATLAQWALAYARRGWAIHPLIPADKRPLLSDWPNRATSDLDTVRAWWEATPYANIGLACGPTGLVAIDLDLDPDKDLDGRQAWAELAPTLGGPWDTLTSNTPRGGRHLVYRAPDGAVIRNSASKLGPGIDVRGAGGYIVLPPSLVDDGRGYAWEPGRGPGDMEPATLPAEVAALLVERLPPPRPGPSAPPRNATAYALAALDGELAELARAQHGQRNHTLNRCAYKLGELVGAGLLSRVEVEEALTQAAYDIGLHNDPNCGPRGIAKTIASGLTAGEANPRQVPAPSSGTVTATNGLPYEPPPAGVAVELAEYHKTDMGNADRLCFRHGQNLRYCDLWAKWLVWTGQRWAIDETRKVERLTEETVRDLYIEAGMADSAEERAERRKWAKASESDAKRRAMLHTAGAKLPTHPAELDRDPWLLAVENGTLDLRTGELLAHRRGDMITKLAPVTYDPAAEAPLWLAFLDRIMQGNANLIGFLQRAIGYSLTGDTREQVFFIAHGSGANGKTTLIETIMALLGDYGTTTPVETLMIKKGMGGIPADIARLRGARLVTATEGEQGQRLAESLVKRLVGQDTITARFLYGEFFEFAPILKLWLATNHKPKIAGTDQAIWRRIKLIPFSVRIPDAEQDKTLKVRLRAELPGVLAWAVRGCLDWQRDGLGAPPEVRNATEAYQTEEDTLAGWLEECCVQGGNAEAGAGELYASYKAWCDANGERCETGTMFGRRLGERGFDKVRVRNKTTYIGLGLAPAGPASPAG